MGFDEQHAVVCSLRLDNPSHGLLVLVLAIFFGWWATVLAAFLQKDEEAKKACFVVALA